jgi:CheY-like chemotaxis protein/CHASE3 domain sensor protein/putative methionine-R-sulfoxide reductase with GAF domain
MLDRLKIRTKIGVSFALGVAIAAAIGLIIYRNANQMLQAARWETHTFQVLTALESLLYNLKDAEAGQRNYLLTGDAQYLDTFRSTDQDLNQKLTELQQLTQDNLRQQKILSQLEPLARDRITKLEQTAQIRRTQGLDAAIKSTSLNQGIDLMADIRTLVEAMRQEELKLLAQRTAESNQAAQRMLYSITLGIPIYAVLLGVIGLLLARDISRPLQQISGAAERVAADDLSVALPINNRRDEIGTLTQTFNQMVANLRETTRQTTEQDWLKTNLANFTELLQGQRNLKTASQKILSQLAPLVSAQHGVFYLMERPDYAPPYLTLLSAYAFQERKHLANQFQLGDGLVGQCALEKQRILLTDVPKDYVKIGSGLGEATPLNIIVLPAVFEDQVIAVIELASFQRFSDLHLDFLDRLVDTLAIALSSILANQRTEELLKQSQILTEELQAQQEELTESNQRLAEQAAFLQDSEYRLKEQQEELQQTNEELQEKTDLLALKNQEMERKNRELEQASNSLEEKARQLMQTSTYKSEFLANMSHELRTPLNSLLILARLLSENGEGNLTTKQVEYSRTIYSAGNDLLALINDILDLTKIESGMMTVNASRILLTDISHDLDRMFRQGAQAKGVEFSIHLDEHLPEAVYTDAKRLKQVLKNLLANAFKFTEQGRVTLNISVATHGWNFQHPTLNQAEQVIAFAVSDTGIGIAPDNHQIVFKAFHQADGTTSRQYGGTGLGLSISREIADLLGGDIQLASKLGNGSTFTLYLPQMFEEYRAHEAGATGQRDGKGREQNQLAEVVSTTSLITPAPLTLDPQPISELLAKNVLDDDRTLIQPGDRTLLIIEDDPNFARILLDMAREQGFKVLAATQGDVGLAMARTFNPNAIVLDVRLPVIDGWQILDRLKHDPNTRHIPIHMMTVEDGQQRSLRQGAIAYLQKPVSKEDLSRSLTDLKAFIERPLKNLLIVEDDELQRHAIVELIGNGDVVSTAVGTGAAALEALRTEHFDCMVLDLGLPDMSGFELIDRIKQQLNLSALPIIIYTGKDLSQREETELRRISDTIIVKGVRSPERLLDETALFLHRVQASMPASKQLVLEQLQQTDPILSNKQVLIVDDDVRNIFALTSLLEQYSMQILYAENGQDGITTLQANPDIDLVLMDIMMPGMDGYEAMQAIRQLPQFSALPIIALTAKAMQGDREKCIAAGAVDYIAKPIDTEQLLSLMRVWLYQ